MKFQNEMVLTFKSLSENESFVRSTVAAFCLYLKPTLDEIADIKTAVSEAVTNCIVHAYENEIGDITIKVGLVDNSVYISVCDNGVGISDIERAREPFFTTKPEQERSGMGFTVMESFMDDVQVFKNKTKGITVRMKKLIRSSEQSVLEG